MKKLFEPIKIRNLEIKNRMIVSAMVTNYCRADGMATEKYIAYHERKARGGWGLIITEDYTISPTAGGFVKLPGLWNDDQIASHQNLTTRVHQAGGKIAAQIYHAGRETTSEITGAQIIAPSALKDPTMPEIPRELTVAEIKELVEEFGDCARRAQAAGFDAVEVHGAHGYLVGAFVSTFSNKRADQYGGTLKNRARFAVEIVKNIKEKCGADYPVIYRMSAVEYVSGGLEIEEAMALSRILEAAGVDCLHVSQGVYASSQVIIPPSVIAKAAYADNAAAIKSVVNIPVIAVGRINDGEIAENLLLAGKADLVTMARASLADPELPNKLRDQQEDDIIYCIGCLQGCIGENGKGCGVRCLVNPLTGMEDEYDLTPAKEPKKVVVVGGGVAGCEAAIAAALKGHQVTLIEKSAVLGGQWLPAAVPIGKAEFNSFVYWQGQQLKKSGVEVLLNTEADAGLIKNYSPDVLIVATGSRPIMPKIKGYDKGNVVNAHDVLNGKVAVGQNVVVVGGGLVGAETADLLSQNGSQVTMIEMCPEILRDGEAAPSYYLKKRFKEYGVTIHTATKLSEIGDDYIIAEQDGKQLRISGVDTVIIAVGVKTDETIFEKLKNIDCEMVKVGDANGVKNGYLGIREGYEAGLRI